MTILFEVILPVFIVIGFGYLVAWRRMFNEVAVDGLMRFAQNFAVPVLLFVNVARLDMAENFSIGMWVAFYSGAFASYFIGWGLALYWLKRSPEDAVAIGFCCLFSNSLLLGIPIMERAYGAEALAGNVAIIAIHSPLLYTFGITMMEVTRARGQSLPAGRIAMRALSGVLHTPLIIGILCGVAMNLLMQAGLVMPEGFWAAAEMMARARCRRRCSGWAACFIAIAPKATARPSQSAAWPRCWFIRPSPGAWGSFSSCRSGRCVPPSSPPAWRRG